MNEEAELMVKVYEKDRSLVMTIPKQIRRKLNIRDGTRLSLKVSGDLITLYKTKKAENMEDPVISTFLTCWPVSAILEIEKCVLRSQIEEKKSRDGNMKI